MKTKIHSSLRLTEEARRLLRALAAQSGVSMTAILEILIRESAKMKGVK